MQPKSKPPPETLDVKQLKGFAKIWNNQADSMIVTPTFWCALNVLTLIMMILFALSYLVYAEASQVSEFMIEYSTYCKQNAQIEQSTGKNVCLFNFDLDVDLQNPAFYYRLDRFYLNHRQIVRSRDYKQLRGKDIGGFGDKAIRSAKKCVPMWTNSQLVANGWIKSSDIPNIDVDTQGADLAYPCGNTAKYKFSDEFEFLQTRVNGDTRIYEINDTNIAHKVDQQLRFHTNEDIKQQNGYWTDVEDEHLMVWYQMETNTDFKKLYGRIDGIMQKGSYTVKIVDNFDGEAIGTQKYLFLSEVGFLGGKNYFLAYLFGFAGLLLAMVEAWFFAVYFVKFRGKITEGQAYYRDLKY